MIQDLYEGLKARRAQLVNDLREAEKQPESSDKRELIRSLNVHIHEIDRAINRWLQITGAA